MSIYGYCRVSTADQAQNGESLDVQKKKIRGYAMMQNMEIRSGNIFVERGVSGLSCWYHFQELRIYFLHQMLGFSQHNSNLAVVSYVFNSQGAILAASVYSVYYSHTDR